ncbi:MAG TPA: hypothetical protein VIM69_12955 [Opitutaceae bacterium]
MFTGYLQNVLTDRADLEAMATTRERLKDRFPKGGTRRMTQLGMLVGSVLGPLDPGENDTLVYASEFAETQALEGYLDSFPSASPTLFQTSIHPSAVQQILIQRQQPVRTFFPMTGLTRLVAQALEVVFLAETPRVILCGGEERGTWLLASGIASERSFAFACALTREKSENAVGTICFAPECEIVGEISLQTFFEALHERRPLAIGEQNAPWLKLSWS